MISFLLIAILSSFFAAPFLQIASQGQLRRGDYRLDPFDKDAFVEALEAADVSVVNEAEVDTRGGADTCVALTTARSARFTTCLHASPSGAQTTAWSRSDYERTVFQRGVVVVYLRNGASRRLLETVDTIMTADDA